MNLNLSARIYYPKIAFAKGGFFEPKEVTKLVDDHMAGRVDNRKKLWTLMMFELWRERWMR